MSNLKKLLSIAPHTYVKSLKASCNTRILTKFKNFYLLYTHCLTFVRDSPKIYLSLYNLNKLQNCPSNNVSLLPICPTRWCARFISSKTIDSNYNIFCAFFDRLATKKIIKLVLRPVGF